MAAKYETGQKVLIKPVSGQNMSIRESAISPYSGLAGEVADFYWIEPPAGERFYLYTVRVEDTLKDLVLYEDEIELIAGKKPKRSQVKSQ